MQALILVAIFGIFSSGAGTQPPQITVRVVNAAEIPGPTLGGAENLAAGIFHSAGVNVNWVDCNSAPRSCRQTSTETLWLHLLDHKPPRLAPDTAGYTVWVPAPDNDSSYAAVSYPAILETAARLQIDASRLLGATIAHELGHLLLGPNSHVPGGIMAPRFRAAEMERAGRGVLLFTTDQARAIRAGVLQRIAHAPGTPVAH